MGYKASTCLKTIAYDLGVSINTVSRALRDCSDISQQTKEKVRQKALELGYLPNNLVYSLRDNKTKLIALVINNINNYYFTLMSEKIIYYLKQENYLSVVISLFGNEFDKEVVKECIYQRVDGIISFVEPTKDSLDLVKLNNISFLMLGRNINDDYCDEIYTNDVLGGKKAADFLISKNCDEFIYININGSECAKRRYDGFIKELKSKKKLIYRSINIEDFDSLYKEIDFQNKKIGIFAYNDEHAFKIIRFLKDNNIDQDQYYLIGYDGIAANLLGTIDIPSIVFNYDKIAKTAVKCMLTTDENRSKIKTCFKVELYEGENNNES